MWLLNMDSVDDNLLQHNDQRLDIAINQTLIHVVSNCSYITQRTKIWFYFSSPHPKERFR